MNDGTEMTRLPGGRNTSPPPNKFFNVIGKFEVGRLVILVLVWLCTGHCLVLDFGVVGWGGDSLVYLLPVATTAERASLGIPFLSWLPFSAGSLCCLGRPGGGRCSIGISWMLAGGVCRRIISMSKNGYCSCPNVGYCRLGCTMLCWK